MSTMDLSVDSIGVEALASLSAAAAAFSAAQAADSAGTPVSSGNLVASSELSSTSSPQYQATFTAESSRCTTPMSENGIASDEELHESSGGNDPTTQPWNSLSSFPVQIQNEDDEEEEEEEDEDPLLEDIDNRSSHSNSNNNISSNNNNILANNNNNIINNNNNATSTVNALASQLSQRFPALGKLSPADSAKFLPEALALLQKQQQQQNENSLIDNALASGIGSQSSRNSSSDTLLNLQQKMLLEQMANFQAKEKELKEKNRKAKMAAAAAAVAASSGFGNSSLPQVNPVSLAASLVSSSLSSSSSSSSSKHRSSYNSSNVVAPQVQEGHQQEYILLLCEYRQVLLDILAKAFKATESQVDPHSGNRLPNKCLCGLNSKISNQVTRTANYVHQLELKHRSLVEPTREKELKYTPKRPPFISGDSYPPFGQMLDSPTGGSNKPSTPSTLMREPASNSLLKQQTKQFKLTPTSAAMGALNKQQQAMVAKYLSQNTPQAESTSLTSSLNSPLNSGIDSGEEEPLNELDLPMSQDVHGDSEMLDEMNNVIPGGKAPKTILEDYLAMKATPQPDEDEEMIMPASQQSFLSQPEVHQPTKFQMTPEHKQMVLKMAKQGMSVQFIARGFQTTKKFIKKIIQQENQKQQNEKQHQSASLLASIINNNGLLMPAKRKISSIDDEEMIGEGSNAEKSDDEGSHDERDSLLQAMSNSKFPMNFGLSSQQSQASSPLTNGKSSSNILRNMFPSNNNPLKNLDPATLSQLSRSLINNPLNMQQMKQAMKKFDQAQKFEQQSQQQQNNMKANLDLLTQRMSMSKSKSIVPGVQRNSMDWSQYSPQANQSQSSHAALQQQAKNLASSLAAGSPLGSMVHSPQIFKKEKKMRLSEPAPSIKLEGSFMEADKNNNTTLNNCNASDSGSVTDTPPKYDPNAPLPPLPPGLMGEEDQETILVPREFHDGVLPAQMMNSLNPNRATKLTLEDFNVVWQLRSQHWTHNQIRKYFEGRGKSISKSSISRIMNGKQRNFQAFFSVVPTKGE